MLTTQRKYRKSVMYLRLRRVVLSKNTILQYFEETFTIGLFQNKGY